MFFEYSTIILLCSYLQICENFLLSIFRVISSLSILCTKAIVQLNVIPLTITSKICLELCTPKPVIIARFSRLGCSGSSLEASLFVYASFLMHDVVM